MHRFFLGAFLIVIVTGSAQAQNTPNKIVTQADAPVRILKYDARYQESSGTFSVRGINHAAEYENTTTRKIVAVQLGLVSFDVWNKFLDQTMGIDMSGLQPGKKKVGAWAATAYGDFSFWSGFVYVSKVRFDDGEIWAADLGTIVQELRQLEDDFDINRLKPKIPEKEPTP